MRSVKIGDLAKMLGRHPETVRRYERRGLIPPARRDPVAGWRIYSQEETEAIRRVLAGDDGTQNERGGP
jgi:DNA-binding transcriptional MerR regulator